MSENGQIPLRLALQQRVLPSYRVGFMDLLAQSFSGGLSIFAGQARAAEGIYSRTGLSHAKFSPAGNVHLFSGGAYLCWQTGLLQWLRDWNPDVLIMEANPRYLHSPAAIRWMKRRGRPVLGWGLGAPLTGRLFGIEKSFWRRFIQSFDAMIAYSPQGAEEYARLGIPHDKIYVAANAVMPRPTEMPARRTIFDPDGPALLYVGRLQERKRVDQLIRACAELVEAGNQLRLWIVGDGPERVELERLAAEVLPTTRFLGELHGADVGIYFWQADLFVLPGTGGLAVQEAMAYGLPVVVAEADGTQSALVRDGNGWTISAGDRNALRDRIRQAIENPARLREMGAESFRIVREEVNLEQMVSVFKDAVRGVVEK
ncbi:MAG: glycosyltransferase family 4 protein [Anaerolineaceae bacterium]|nr:glycosyltransferase family 4 protein [Anaerolineaceae bacterium]